MIGRSIYAHWLDPDYLGWRVLPSDQVLDRTRQFQGFLKMHAIAGDCMHISDVQLIESRALLLSFADSGFRGFLDRHPEFLCLIGQPDFSLGGRSQRLATISSGLARIYRVRESYIPNTFHSKSLIPSIAELFMNANQDGDAERLFGHRGRFTEFLSRYADVDRDLVEGLYFALRHFVKNHAAPVPQSTCGTEPSYFEELEKSLSNISEDDVDLRNTLINTMSMALSPDEKRRRSLILAKLPHTGKIGHPDRTKYILIAQAWNLAVGSRMAADCDSAYCFRGVAPIPIHSGLTPGRTTFTVRMGAEVELFDSIPHYDWHPALLQWQTISRIREECGKEIGDYQSSLACYNNPTGQSGYTRIEASFTELAKVASRVIAEDHCRLGQAPQWLSQTCSIAGSLDGASNSLAFLPLLLKAKLLAKTIKGSAGAYETFRSAFLARDRRLLRAALERFGQQYNLHRISAAPGAGRYESL